jgi:hypothetical protein
LGIAAVNRAWPFFRYFSLSAKHGKTENALLPFMGSLVIVAAMVHSRMSAFSVASYSEAEPRAFRACLKTVLRSTLDLLDRIDYLSVTCGVYLHMHDFGNNHCDSSF